MVLDHIRIKIGMRLSTQKTELFYKMEGKNMNTASWNEEAVAYSDALSPSIK